jgi:hypothetical protein
MKNTASLDTRDTTHRANEGELFLRLPSGFDIDSLPGNGERPVRVAYVAHLITTRPLNRRGFVSLHKKTLQSIVSRKAETEAFRFLRPLLEVDHHFRKGKESKGYRWKSEVGDAVLHRFHAPRFKKYLKGWRRGIRETYSDLEMVLEADMKLADLPVSDLSELVAKIPPKACVRSESHRRNVIIASGEMIQRGEMGVITTSKTTGRIHCSINRLSSLLRKHLTLDGQRVVEIDLASSQPYFLTTLFPCPPLREAVERGRFYQRVNERLPLPFDLSDPTIYASFKQRTLATLYARPVHGCLYWEKEGSQSAQILSAMDSAYPGIVPFLTLYRKKNGDTALPIALQREESEVFIRGVLPALQKDGVKAIPIHDAILCQWSEREKVRGEMEKRLWERTGVRAKVRG